MNKAFKQDKGQAGLTILLSMIVLLFVIGLLVMIFSIMSSEIRDQDLLYETSSLANATAESVAQTTLNTGHKLDYGNYRNAVCSILKVTNASASGLVIESGNYTESAECTIKNASGTTFFDSAWYVNYSYYYDADQYGTAEVINDTAVALGGVIDWFDIFIVIGAMVVLILLTVIIITALRGSGITGGASKGANSVGTA